MMNVEKRVFKRKLKKLQDAAKPKHVKTDEDGTGIEKGSVSFSFIIASHFFKLLIMNSLCELLVSGSS